MSKRVNSREFFHNFAKLHASLKPGESLIVTKHGKPLGEFRKTAERKTFDLPDLPALGLGPAGTPREREAAYARLIRSIENESVS